MMGNLDQATEVLINLKTEAPEWFRYQQTAREIVEDLIATAKRMPNEQQRSLAMFLGASL